MVKMMYLLCSNDNDDPKSILIQSHIRGIIRVAIRQLGVSKKD